MGMLQEFKDFAMKGNVVDLAVGVVIGGAFGKIIAVLVDKIIMPAVGMLTGGIDFGKYDIPLKAADEAGKGGVNLGIGSFATEIINFLIVAFAIFMVVKAMNTAQKKFQKQQAAAPPAPPEDVVLLREIRDALRTR
ncbi:MAG: large-conductance mechanosensitive channel protein MscL [Planctomycetota bacterium]|nr:large-conductance mechanosensitive channel protein MscL [Planctomycetota bacterium]MDA1177401.1 large-conductance mechanosensitive channel protein MscL [Planctomycetota bacterium]